MRIEPAGLSAYVEQLSGLERDRARAQITSDLANARLDTELLPSLLEALASRWGSDASSLISELAPLGVSAYGAPPAAAPKAKTKKGAGDAARNKKRGKKARARAKKARSTASALDEVELIGLGAERDPSGQVIGYQLWGSDQGARPVFVLARVGTPAPVISIRVSRNAPVPLNAEDLEELHTALGETDASEHLGCDREELEAVLHLIAAAKTAAGGP